MERGVSAMKKILLILLKKIHFPFMFQFLFVLQDAVTVALFLNQLQEQIDGLKDVKRKWID